MPLMVGLSLPHKLRMPVSSNIKIFSWAEGQSQVQNSTHHESVQSMPDFLRSCISHLVEVTLHGNLMFRKYLCGLRAQLQCF